MNINECSHENNASISPITDAPTRMWVCEDCGWERPKPVTVFERNCYRKWGWTA